MELYTYFRSSASYRVRIALGLKGIAAKMHYVNLLKGEQRAEGYTKLNPQKIIPSLIDKEHTLGQSLAIMEYLEEAYPEPAILPKDIFARAYVRQIALAIACEIAPIGNLKVRNFLGDKFQWENWEKDKWVAYWITEGLPGVEALLANSGLAGEFCCGDTPGMADCCLVPQVYNAERFKVDLAPYPLITGIVKHCEAHPAFAAAHPSRQKDAV